MRRRSADSIMARTGIPSAQQQAGYMYASHQERQAAQGGVRLEPDNFVKRALKPILKELGLDGAAHAFRHGNATLLDSLHAPMAVRQERLGHMDARTTMGYTHLVTADDMRIAGELGALLDKGFFAQDLPKFPPNVETTSELISEVVYSQEVIGCRGWI